MLTNIFEGQGSSKEWIRFEENFLILMILIKDSSKKPFMPQLQKIGKL